MQTKIRPGEIQAREGSVNPARSDKTGALVVSQAHGKFNEAVDQGNVYGVCSQAGVTSQAGLSATTPVLTLWNPAGSEVYASVWFVGVGFTVVFAAIAAVWVAVGTDTVDAAVTGTLTTTHRNLKLGVSQGNKVIPFTAATLPAAPVAVALLGTGLTGAVNLAPSAVPMGGWFNGSIILKPGTNLTVQTIAASGAGGTWCEYIWEEIPIESPA